MTKISSASLASTFLVAASLTTIGGNVHANSHNKKWDWSEAKLAVLMKRGPNGQYYEESILDYNFNTDTKLPIASITKTMATLVIFDMIDAGQLSLDDKIPVRPESLRLKDSDFAIRGLPKNLKEVTVRDALIHANRLSSNPMVYNLAVYAAGTEEKFVAMMNQKAADLKMTNTRFVNSHGLPLEGDRKTEATTANDLKKLVLHLSPLFERFQEVSHAPLPHWIDNNPAKKQDIKEELRQLGAVFKTASIAGCKSLLSMVKVGDAIGASIHLCAPSSQLRFEWGKTMMQKIKDIFGEDEGARTTGITVGLQQSSPLDPPSIR